MELTKKRLEVLLWILENKNRRWTIYEIEKSNTLNYSPIYNLVKEMENIGFVVKINGKYQLANAPDLIKIISINDPFRVKPKRYYFINKTMRGKMEIVKKSKLDYSFTLFCAGELLFPYIKTEDVHVYVKKQEIEKWNDYLIEKGVKKSVEKEANLILMPVESEFYFGLSREEKSFKIAPTGLILSDLLSFGGLGEEHARIIKKKWLES